jgi:hypothetical protein
MLDQLPTKLCHFGDAGRCLQGGGSQAGLNQTTHTHALAVVCSARIPSSCVITMDVLVSNWPWEMPVLVDLTQLPR